MSKLTWFQYRFMAEYVIARAFVANSSYSNSNTINSNRDYQRGVDVLASVFHQNLKGCVDLAAQRAVFPSSWYGNQFSDGLNAAFIALNLPAPIVHYQTVNSWAADAFDVLPSDPSTYASASGGGGGGSFTLPDWSDFAESIAVAIAEHLEPVVIQLNSLNPDMIS